MPLVFVYGTLRAGEANDLNEAARRHGLPPPRLVGQGTVRGRLHDFGAYPGYVPVHADDDGDAAMRVVGDIYDIDAALVPVLDEIEEVYPGQASLFIRAEQPVRCESGSVACLLYPVQAEAAAAMPLIACGDWVAYRKARDSL